MSRDYAEQVMRDQCNITWDDEGGIRDTTDEERIQLRADQAKRGGIPESGAMICCKCNAANVKISKKGRCTVCEARAHLASAEIPGLTYEPCSSGLAASRESQFLIRQAHEWAMAAA